MPPPSAARESGARDSAARDSAARERVLQLASERLTALVGSRESTVVPESQPIVIDPPAHALRPIARIAGAVCLLVALLVWLNRPQAVTPIDQQSAGVSMTGPSSAASGDGMNTNSSVTSPRSTTIVVDVEGHVRHPGLVTLPADSRVADALSEAGGLTRRIAPGSLNLAQKVTDGQLIVVSSAPALTSAQSGAIDTSGSGGTALININVASSTDLDALPGVGPVMSSRIVAWRTDNGGFKTVDDLQQVPGIGPKVFANLKPLVCI